MFFDSSCRNVYRDVRGRLPSMRMATPAPLSTSVNAALVNCAACGSMTELAGQTIPFHRSLT